MVYKGIIPYHNITSLFLYIRYCMGMEYMMAQKFMKRPRELLWIKYSIYSVAAGDISYKYESVICSLHFWCSSQVSSFPLLTWAEHCSLHFISQERGKQHRLLFSDSKCGCSSSKSFIFRLLMIWGKKILCQWWPGGKDLDRTLVSLSSSNVDIYATIQWALLTNWSR